MELREMTFCQWSSRISLSIFLLKLQLFQKTADKKPTRCALNRRFQVDHHVVVSILQPNLRWYCLMLMCWGLCWCKGDPGFTVRHASSRDWFRDSGHDDMDRRHDSATHRRLVVVNNSIKKATASLSLFLSTSSALSSRWNYRNSNNSNNNSSSNPFIDQLYSI